MGFNASALSATTIKTFVDRLNKRNKEKTTWPPKRSMVQEDIASVLGYASWHALNKALDTPKPNATSNPPIETPVALLKWSIPEEYLNLDVVWSRFDWNKHSLVFSNDEVRSDFFAKFAAKNPSRPMLLIQGLLALPAHPENWSTVNQSGQLAALMIGTLDFSSASAQEIVDVLKIWNTSITAMNATELLLMVCDALIQLRDSQNLSLNLDVLVDHLEPHNLVLLAQRTDLKANTLDDLNTYIHNLDDPSFGLPHHRAIAFEWKRIKDAVNRFYSPKDTNHRVLVSHLFKPSSGVQQQIEQYLDWWVAEHTGGLVVVDGLHSDSYLYEFLLRRLAVYKRDGVGVVIGCANSGDFPNNQMYEQIQGRIHNHVRL